MVLWCRSYLTWIRQPPRGCLEETLVLLKCPGVISGPSPAGNGQQRLDFSMQPHGQQGQGNLALFYGPRRFDDGVEGQSAGGAVLAGRCRVDIDRCPIGVAPLDGLAHSGLPEGER